MTIFSGNRELKEVLKLARIVLWLVLIVGTVLILKFFGHKQSAILCEDKNH
jgi:hypothetical protein